MSIQYRYESSICKYCALTDYGCAPVNTGPHNLCEGRGCEQALNDYNDNQADDEDKFDSIEEAF